MNKASNIAAEKPAVIEWGSGGRGDPTGAQIDNRWLLTKRLGEGGFASVYSAHDNQTSQQCAVKMENKGKLHGCIPNEIQIYRHIHAMKKQLEGIPHLISAGTSMNFNFLVMELLGDDVYKTALKKEKYSIVDIVGLGVQMLQRLKEVHETGVVHVDVKPDNMVCGIDSKKHIIYLTDFGLSTRYLDDNQKHVHFKRRQPFRGTQLFASRNVNAGYLASRRDDIESLFYSLVFMARGTLPWARLLQGKKKGTMKQILRSQKLITAEYLCKGLPDEFVEICRIVYDLSFLQRPPYEQIQALLVKAVGSPVVNSFDNGRLWRTMALKEKREEEREAENRRELETKPGNVKYEHGLQQVVHDEESEVFDIYKHWSTSMPQVGRERLLRKLSSVSRRDIRDSLTQYYGRQLGLKRTRQFRMLRALFQRGSRNGRSADSFKTDSYLQWMKEAQKRRKKQGESSQRDDDSAEGKSDSGGLWKKVWDKGLRALRRFQVRMFCTEE